MDGQALPVLKPASAADGEFLLRVYASTREEELSTVPWPPEAKAAFLQQQFWAQDAHYRRIFPNGSFDIVLVNDDQVGRLSVDRADGEIRIIDIALLPERRGQGIGTRLVQSLMAEARAADVPMTLHVEWSNSARAWYERLGFRQVVRGDVYISMRWTPS